ncbi:MAG: DUF4445 domain-containing protein [Blautia sp.]|nr:DUF4445 domain-containing protein [Blautia sp.]
MFQIYFSREDLTVQAEPQANLLEVMRKAGLHPDAPCGGHGKCGKCKVGIRTAEQSEPQTVLACQVQVESDLIVDSMLSGKGYSILTEGVQMATTFDPIVRQVQIEVEPCIKGESTSDWSRLILALQKEGLLLDGPAPEPDPEIASQAGPLQRSTGGRMWALVSGKNILAVSADKMEYYLAAFDIGTTTVVGYLLDGNTGEAVTVTSRLNPQAEYGGDVINRANYSLEHGTEQVTGCIRQAIREMLAELAQKAGIDAGKIAGVSIAGNTCMHHLFMGISVDSLVHAPYNPAVSEPMIRRAADYQFGIHPKAPIFMLPNIAGFVGADTVACLVSTDLAEVKDWTLLIDIGTNGEMVLARDHEMIACSTAAGPAFEGAGITHGMRGSEGAISKVRWAEDHWDYEVVGGTKPRGICGSGLLDLVSELLLSGQMDEMGELQTEEPRIILADKDESSTGAPVTLEQKDVRQLQLAKAAIAAGVHLLAESRNIDVTDISEVWLAGAFGSFMSPESACNIGLIPPELRGRIKAIGNAAGEGAKRVLLERSAWDKAAYLAAECDFLELATIAEFQDRYVDELEFPEL